MGVRVPFAAVGEKKVISITYSECVSVALGMRFAKHMLSIILATVACYVVLHFSKYLIKGLILGRGGGGGCSEHKMCVLIFCRILSEMFLIIRRFQRDII